MSNQFFLRITTAGNNVIRGASTLAGYRELHEVEAFQLGFDRDLNGGSGVGQPVFSNATIFRRFALGSLPVFQAGITSPFMLVELFHVQQFPAGPRTLLKVDLTRPLLMNYSVNGSAGESFMQETYVLAYERIAMTYSILRPDGSVNGIQSASWDIITGMP
jgi:type VI protein secretion system component Hcp